MVALLTESVDRNIPEQIVIQRKAVALLTESVDRNAYTPTKYPAFSRSLSSRRAWIEILKR